MTSIQRALLALDGLSVGDSFGEQFFIDPDEAARLIDARSVPQPPWTFTDDTEMACSVVNVLRNCRGVDQNRLADSFALHYDPKRGYGPNMHRALARMSAGEFWSVVANSLFDGAGSHGNGAAMRAAPIGAYFAKDLEAVTTHAHHSAEVTHAHPDAISGAVAVALAAALAYRVTESPASIGGRNFLDLIAGKLPVGRLHERIRQAARLPTDASVRLAVSALGNGMQLSAVDTVPLALWCASRHLDSYEDALWETVSALGDRDTTCAIVGGIVAMSVNEAGIPVSWIHAREPLPSWIVESD